MSTNGPPTVPLDLGYVEKTLGVYFVSYMFSMVLYGFTFFQSYMYYTRYSKDPLFYKAIVAILCGIDTAVASVFSQTLYHYLVTLFPLPYGVELATTHFCAQFELSIIAIFIVQIFYSYTVWSTTKNPVFAGSVAVMSMTAFALSTTSAAHLFQHREFVNLAMSPNKTIAALGQAFTAAAAMVAFTGFLTAETLPKDFKPISSLFDWVVAYSISYGGLVIIIQLAYLFIFVGTPENFYWLPFQVVATKLLVLGAITFLNSRESGSPRISHVNAVPASKDEWSGRIASQTFTPSLQGSTQAGSSGRRVSVGGVSGVSGASGGVGVGPDTMSAIEFKPIVVDAAHAKDLNVDFGDLGDEVDYEYYGKFKMNTRHG